MNLACDLHFPPSGRTYCRRWLTHASTAFTPRSAAALGSRHLRQIAWISASGHMILRLESGLFKCLHFQEQIRGTSPSVKSNWTVSHRRYLQLQL